MLYKKLFVSVILFLSLVFTQAGELSVQNGRLVPKLLNYQGYLTDTLCIPIDDDLDMTFKIFDALSSGNELWSETQLNVPVESGVFSVILGEGTAIPDSVFADFTSTWLELTLEGPQTLTPRTRITSVGYAYTSTYSDTAEYAHVGADSDWTLGGNVLYPAGDYGLSMRSGNVLYGTNDSSHVNFGIACTTGTSGQNCECISIGGGYGNTAEREHATISGGLQNIVTGIEGTIGGGALNQAQGLAASIGGGEENYTNASYAHIGGGYNNVASGEYSTVSGGERNSVNDYYAAVGGGYYNIVNGISSVVAGGDQNEVHENISAICGGSANYITGGGAFIGGGTSNFVHGEWASIVGGYSNTISSGGAYSYLFGVDANLTQDSTFMVDMPHIRFGDETNGYEFPTADGSTDQVLITDGSGQLSWANKSPTAFTPANPGDSHGDVGNIAWDDDYVYVKTSNGWKRAQLSSW